MIWLVSAALGYAQSVVELRILATDPAPDVLLALQQPFFMHFEVVSLTPLAVVG